MILDSTSSWHRWADKTCTPHRMQVHRSLYPGIRATGITSVINSDNGTDSDTSSDDYENFHIDWTDVDNMVYEDAIEHLYYQMRYAKRRWRRFRGKPTRRARRFANRATTGTSPVRRSSNKYHMTCDYLGGADHTSFLINRNRDKSTRTSGKGFGRVKNPIGQDGKVMTCRTCGSEEHFQRECPQNKGAGVMHAAPDAQLEQIRPTSRLLTQANSTADGPPTKMARIAPASAHSHPPPA